MADDIDLASHDGRVLGDGHHTLPLNVCRVCADQGQVDAHPAPDNSAADHVTPVCLERHGGRVADHMSVGQDGSFIVDHDAGPQTAASPDPHHAVAPELVDLADRTGAGRLGDNVYTTGVNMSLIHLPRRVAAGAATEQSECDSCRRQHEPGSTQAHGPLRSPSVHERPRRPRTLVSWMPAGV